MPNTKKVAGKVAGQPGEKYREKKIADTPKFYRKNERRGEELESEGFPTSRQGNKNLWDDPPHPNQAKAQVRGSGEVGEETQALRAGEDEHDVDPTVTHYGHDAGEIQEHQDAIIDKHADKGNPRIYSHRVRSKEAYALAPESRTITKGFKGANGPSGNPQARRN